MRISDWSSDVCTSDLIPEDWGLDSEGQPTTDPAAVKTLMPMSGAKGSGLSLMIEILASLAAGHAVLVPALAGATGTRMTGVAIALAVATPRAPGAFAVSGADLARANQRQTHTTDASGGQ